MHPLHRVWSADDQQAAFNRKVQSFLSHLIWQEDEKPEGGITWIELYALYSIHGGSRDEKKRRSKEVLKRPPMLKAQLAQFKKAVRKLNLHTVKEGDAWRLETSKVMRNRLMHAGINNRQAAVRGMPFVSLEDARKLMHTLLALRGYDKKKHLDAWKEGCLNLKPGELNLQGTAQKWRHTIPDGEVWNVDGEGRVLDYLVPNQYKPPDAQLDLLLELQHICCPACGSSQKVGASRLRTHTGFSNILCKECKEKQPSSKWRCRCKLLWTKCPRHLHKRCTAIRRPAKVMTLKDKRTAIYGIVRPLPLARSRTGRRSDSSLKTRAPAAEGSRKSTASEPCEFKRIKFNIGSSSLAKRFPHLVQTSTLT